MTFRDLVPIQTPSFSLCYVPPYLYSNNHVCFLFFKHLKANPVSGPLNLLLLSWMLSTHLLAYHAHSPGLSSNVTSSEEPSLSVLCDTALQPCPTLHHITSSLCLS